VAIGKAILAPDQVLSETVNNPVPDSFRPQNQRSRPQNPKQTRPQLLDVRTSNARDVGNRAFVPADVVSRLGALRTTLQGQVPLRLGGNFQTVFLTLSCYHPRYPQRYVEQPS